MRFWQTQLGYVYFLGHQVDTVHYYESPSIFKALVATDPQDTNAHFWLGYTIEIVFADNEQARQEHTRVLALDPQHPYANLCLAGLVDRQASVTYLRRTLAIQPANFSALHQLAEILLLNNNHAEIRNILEYMVTHHAYVEQNYGIMNEYINGVFVGSIDEDEWRENVRALVQ